MSSAALAIVQPSNDVGKPASVPKPKPPAHLTAESKRWWNEILKEYDLEGHHLRLLQAACEAWERMQAARAAIATYGLTFTDGSGSPKVRPEISIERDSKIVFARLIRELDLDCEAPAETRRPPAIRSNRGA
ncbi:P27 family phage terminase small subunit [Mesorhizobium calcicola]|uniref:P27 family phage terminase small subunit n=1 Tax=Mesorhizobium calcicola TaxID=1300310 RepID=A0ABW4WAU4_9HYPH